VRKNPKSIVIASPDLNPIEMMFAKLKTLLRKADERSIAEVAPPRSRRTHNSPAQSRSMGSIGRS